MYCLRPSDSKLTQIKRLRARPPAEIDELGGAHLVRLDSAPQQVEHGGTRRARPDAFPPAIEVGEDPAPPHHRRPELAGDLHDILAPLVAQMIPGRFDRTVGGAQRFHELHVEIGRQFEQRLRIDPDGAAVLATGSPRADAAAPSVPAAATAAAAMVGLLEECSSLHASGPLSPCVDRSTN